MAASMKQVCSVRQFCCFKQSVSLAGYSCALQNAKQRHYFPQLQLKCTSYVRCYSTQQPEDKVKPPTRPKRYALDRLVKFITNSADKLEKRVPRVFQVYRTFRTGISGFVSDTKDFYRVSSRLWSGESLGAFSRKDLELYRQFSSDLPLVGLIFVIAFAPGGVAVFPIAYFFPRHLLSHHFWTPQQKEEFQLIALTRQTRHYDSILDYLHLLSQHIEEESAKETARRAIQKLESTVLLNSKEILELFPLFEGKPYNMECLSLRHMRHLGKCLGLSVRRKRLVKDALLLHFMDVAMVREGIQNMTEDELDKSCAWRGLNPQGLGSKEKVSYLESWTQISLSLHGFGSGSLRTKNKKTIWIGEENRTTDTLRACRSQCSLTPLGLKTVGTGDKTRDTDTLRACCRSQCSLTPLGLKTVGTGEENRTTDTLRACYKSQCILTPPGLKTVGTGDESRTTNTLRACRSQCSLTPLGLKTVGTGDESRTTDTLRACYKSQCILTPLGLKTVCT